MNPKRNDEAGQPVRSSAWVGEVVAALRLLENATENLRSQRAGDALVAVLIAGEHLHSALDSQPRPSPTAKLCNSPEAAQPKHRKETDL